MNKYKVMSIINIKGRLRAFFWRMFIYYRKQGISVNEKTIK